MYGHTRYHAKMPSQKMSTANLVVSICLLIYPCLCKQCVGNGPCSCTFDDGSGTVDLTSLGNEVGGARFQGISASSDNFLYNYNPCFAFSTGSCTNVAACQTTPDISESYNLGAQESATWSYDGNNIQVAYTSTTDILRETFVTVVCDPDQEEDTLTAQGETTPQQYYMELRSQCACADGCSALGPPDEGLSGGTILLIVVIVFGFIYLVAGMTFNRYRGGKEGVEMLPNRGFWSALPGLIKCYTSPSGSGNTATKRRTSDRISRGRSIQRVLYVLMDTNKGTHESEGALFTVNCAKRRGSSYNEV